MSSSGDGHVWRALPEMSSPHVFPAVAVCQDQLLVIGGCEKSGQPQDICEAFDLTQVDSPDANWTTLPPLLSPRAGTQVVTIDKKVYSVGGVGENKQTVASVDEFDLGAQTWRNLAQLPVGVQGCSVIERQGKLFIAGGMAADNSTHSTFSCLDRSKGKLAQLPPLPHARYAPGKVVHNDTLFLIGGRDGRTPIEFCDAFDFRAFKWRSLPDLPSHSRVFPIHAISQSKVFVMGGLDPTNVAGGFSTLCHVLDLDTECWTQCADLLIGRADAAVFTMPDDKILLAAGFDNTGKPSKTCHIYNPQENSWKESQDLTSSHLSCGFAASDQALFVAGGIKEDGFSQVVDMLTIEAV